MLGCSYLLGRWQRCINTPVSHASDKTTKRPLPAITASEPFSIVPNSFMVLGSTFVWEVEVGQKRNRALAMPDSIVSGLSRRCCGWRVPFLVPKICCPIKRSPRLAISPIFRWKKKKRELKMWVVVPDALSLLFTSLFRQGYRVTHTPHKASNGSAAPPNSRACTRHALNIIAVWSPIRFSALQWGPSGAHTKEKTTKADCTSHTSLHGSKHCQASSSGDGCPRCSPCLTPCCFPAALSY
jgi:hypothetical protein